MQTTHYERDGNTWLRRGEIIQPDPLDFDLFGAALYLSNNILAAQRINFNNRPNDTGALYLFELQNGEWTYQQILISDSMQDNIRFGGAAAIRDDLLVVGCVLCGNSGEVHVFQKQGGFWTEVQRLAPSVPTESRSFGSKIFLQDNTLVVGEPYAQNNDLLSGRVIVFERQQGQWVETQVLIGSSSLDNREFGKQIVLKNRLLLVSAPLANQRQGKIYVFEKNAGTLYGRSRGEIQGAISQLGRLTV